MNLDEIDRAILRVLAEDARMSMTELAKRVRISRASAHTRFKRLVDEHIITGFTTRVDHAKAGEQASAYVSLTVDQSQSQWTDIRAALAAIPEIHHLAFTGGEYDVVMLVRARDNRDLRRVMLEKIQTIPAVISTRTQIIFYDTHSGGGSPTP